MKLEFTEDDFNITNFTSHRIATLANERLQEMLAESIVLYGNPRSDFWTTKHLKHDQYTALLVNVEPIKPKECEHYIEPCMSMEADQGWRCKKCKKKIKVLFEVVE